MRLIESGHIGACQPAMRLLSLLLCVALFVVPVNNQEDFGNDEFDYNEEQPTPEPNEANELGSKLGGPCLDRCKEEMLHTFCNKASNRCECDSAHPIALNNHVCIAPLRLGELCYHGESCTYLDPNALCVEVSPFYYKCACRDNYQPSNIMGRKAKCIPVRKELPINTDVPTVLGVGVGMGLFTGLTCLVLRLFSNARFSQPRGHYANANLAPPITLTNTPTSAPPSRRSSGRSTGTASSRRPSYSMLAPPSRGGSRRPSSSSVRSHTSVRSYNASRGERGSHEPLRPTLSAPTPEASLKLPNRSPAYSQSPSPTAEGSFKKDSQPCVSAQAVSELIERADL